MYVTKSSDRKTYLFGELNYIAFEIAVAGHNQATEKELKVLYAKKELLNAEYKVLNNGVDYGYLPHLAAE